MPEASRSVALATRVYRLALGWWPRSFETYRDAAAADFERIAREERRSGGRVAVVVALATALADLTKRTPAEWRRARREREGVMKMWTRELVGAAKGLARRPLFATVVIATLALGIGATVTIFTVVDAILIRPLPYPDSERIVSFDHHAPGLDLPRLGNSAGMANFYRESAPFAEGFSLYSGSSRNLTGLEVPERIDGLEASPSLFDVLRVEPALGRRFTAAEGEPGRPAVVMLSHGLWTRVFGADPDVLGRTLEMDGVPHEVVGVMPRGFAYPDPDVEAYVPYVIGPDAPFGTFGMGAVARLAPGVELADARREVEALQARIPEQFEGVTAEFLEGAGWSVSLQTLRERTVGDVRAALWVVLGTVGFVLLIACANVANLLLVRAELRQRELAIRAALGAGRGRLAVAYLSESLVLAVIAGAVALFASRFGVDALVAYGPEGIPRLHEVGVGWRTAGFTVGTSLLAGVLLGGLPVLRYLGRSFARVLRSGGRGTTDGRERHRTRNVLVAAQLALALVLLVGSGLMLRSFQSLRALDPGIDPSGVLAVGMSLGEGVPNEEGARFYQRVAEEVAALPGVASVGLTNNVPLASGGANGGSFFIESQPRPDDGTTLPPVALYKAIGADYLDVMDQPLLEGRALTRADWETGTPAVLVNHAFARQFFDGRALGERIKWDSAGAFADIVGVVGDVREFGLREDIRPLAYIPMVVGDWGYPNLGSMALVVRSADEDRPVSVASIRDVVLRLNDDVPLTTVRTMDEILAADLADTSFTMVLLGIAAIVAVLLGAVGLFGVIAYVVSQRTREIGVRMALGAEPGSVQSMVVRQGMAVAAVGIVLGLVGAVALTRLMASLLFGVSNTDPVTYAVVTAGLAAVATLASWLPARRASRVDPVRALTAE